MSYTIKVYDCGAPDVMKWEATAIPTPKAGEVLLRHTAVGLNFIDSYYRSGLYTSPPMPFTPGIEAVGIVEALGEGVDHCAIGDRVAYCKGPQGAYAHYRTISTLELLPVPEDISNEHAVGALLQGMTAHFLLKRTFMLHPKMTVLVQGASDDVGTLLCQWAKHIGARVIGTVDSEDKLAWAKENGCDYALVYTQDDIAAEVRKITKGEGVHVAYDAVGKDTFMQSIDSLAGFGMMVSYGQSSGPLPEIDPLMLMEKGSLFFTRPSLLHYKAIYSEYITAAHEIFEMIQSGVLQVHIGQSYYLSDVAQAHRDLESGNTRGSTILIPDPI